MALNIPNHLRKYWLFPGEILKLSGMKKNNLHILILALMLFQLRAKSQTMEDATILSHNGKFNEAEKVFSKLIEKDSKNTALLVARGFNSAWNKKYTAAQACFKKALQIDPGHKDAAKGMAYTYLYKGNYTKAAAAFSELIKTNPPLEELHFALGLALLNLQKKNKAYAQFESVLSIDRSNTEAKKYKRQIKSERGLIELSALGGLSVYDGKSKFGLRQVQTGYHINSEYFIYARYDNSLAQDNYFFLKNNYSSRAFLGGLYARWHYRIGSKVEYGYRNLPSQADQNIFQTEQIIFLPNNFTFKFGGSIVSSAQSPNEWMLMGGISVPAGNKLKIEPHYYYMHRQVNENRLLLNVNYTFSTRTNITLGGFTGSEKNIKTNIKNNVFGLYAYSNFHITGPLSGIILTRYEKDAFDRAAFIGAAGLKIIFGINRF
jgi:tetratricopeptide (TPR) repeat protein